MRTLRRAIAISLVRLLWRSADRCERWAARLYLRAGFY
jgi:hypothetical protein